MQNDLRNRLLEQFPALFKDSTGQVIWASEGIWTYPEAGDGWYGLVRRMCEDILEHCGIYDKPLPRILGVYPQYGRLRVLSDTTDKEILDIVAFYQRVSGLVCESCGTTLDVSRDIRLYKFLCHECRRQKYAAGEYYTPSEEEVPELDAEVTDADEPRGARCWDGQSQE
jgi:hypothetical protein